MELLLVFVLGAALGGGIGWLVGHSSSQTGADSAVLEARHLASLAEVRQMEGVARAEVEAELAASQATVQGLHRELASAQAQLKERAASEAGENKLLQQMAPIAERLQAMEAAYTKIEKDRNLQHGQLAAEIKATRESAEQSKAAAQMLNSALRNNAVRGAYGEIQLESIVEAAGMIKRVDFTTQESIAADSGARRPDMVIKLPGGKGMAVDAKVPYAAFIESHKPELDEAQRAALLKEHAKQVRAHVNALADKSYFTGLAVSPEFTVAFIPTEAILNVALETDPALMDYAFSKGVVLATPVNLFAVLKSVAFTWKQEEIAENAREVVEAGQELFRRLRKAAETAAKLGKSINTVVNQYNDFAGTFERRVLPQARKFEDMEISALPQLENDARQFTAPEFAALADVERPELELFEPEISAEGLEEIG